MSDRQENNGPKLSKGLKIFLVVGTVFMILFSVVYYATHSGSSEYFRTQIEPDSNLADKELIVKQDTIRRDTAAADSANKEEVEQAKKVFNSIRGNVRHKTATDDNESDEEATESGATEGTTETPVPSEGEKPSTNAPAAKSEQSAKVPKVENIE